MSGLVTTPEDAARLLLDGKLPPEDFALRIASAPRAMRESTTSQALGWAYAFFVLTCLGLTTGACVALIKETPLRDAVGLACLAVLTWVLACATEMLSLRARGRRAVVSREVNDEYRQLCHVHFIKNLTAEVEALEGHVPSPAFVQAVVAGMQHTLVRVGVPQPQVCILRVDPPGAYVSYYAGSQAPELARETVLTDVSAVASRRVVYRRDCRLGCDEPPHKMVIVAAATKLADIDAESADRVIAILSDTCRAGSVLD